MERIYSSETIKFIGQKVKLAGWVEVRRDHGKLIFIDLRDRAGIVQLVFIPKDKELHQTADSLRSEWVIEVVGSVNQRPKGMENPNVETGSVEVLVENLVILNESKTPPFEIVAAETQVGEEARLRYRYIDLRRAKMAKNLKERHRIVKFMRDFMDTRDFWEIETPFLTKGTPEGAREFAIPSRLHRGKFYVLPQSPQQFKQLLMVSGVEKYFQVARCFRDEDPRGDRQPEFTQLDIEMSFADENAIMGLTEDLLIELVRKIFPEKKRTTRTNWLFAGLRTFRFLNIPRPKNDWSRPIIPSPRRKRKTWNCFMASRKRSEAGRTISFSTATKSAVGASESTKKRCRRKFLKFSD